MPLDGGARAPSLGENRGRRRARGGAGIVRQLEELRSDPEGERHVEEAVKRLRGRPGDPESFDLLDRLINQQAYRPAFWQVATETMEYRRFFDVNDLIGIRVELPSVFETTHELALRLAADGAVTGLRIDHVDGLYDPAGYLRDLQAALPSRDGSPLYVVVEKILAPQETLAAGWPVEGTTGYEFSAAVTGALCDPEGVARLTRGWRRFTGIQDSLKSCATAAPRCATSSRASRPAFPPTGARARRDRHARHLSRRTWFGLLAETTASLPVYRTYVRDFNVTREDVAVLDALLDDVRERGTFPPVAVEFLRLVLLLRYPSAVPEEQHAVWPRFVMGGSSYGAGDGQGARGHRPLRVHPCLAPNVWAPAPSRLRSGGRAARERGPPLGPAVARLERHHPRHQAQRGRARPCAARSWRPSAAARARYRANALPPHGGRLRAPDPVEEDFPVRPCCRCGRSTPRASPRS